MGKIGVIGGSGLYDLPGLAKGTWKAATSPWGEASDKLYHGVLGEQEVVFLPRHGRGHRHSPSEINYRANIDALKRAGVTHIVSVSAVGGLRKRHAPGTFVMVDQYIDRTIHRPRSFFGTGCVAHVSLAEPVCPTLRRVLFEACEELSIPAAHKGTYVCIEGPQFSTKAESHWYREMDCDVIGMTNMPEARLAREAELHYASVAMVTDYDCWHEGHGHVTVEMVLGVLKQNTENAKRLLQHVLPTLLASTKEEVCPCPTALDHAVMTAPAQRDAALLEKLDAVAGRVLPKAL
jgi:5'-methylthioadenosine phosphorylase